MTKPKWEIAPFDPNDTWVDYKSKYWWVMVRMDNGESDHSPRPVLAILGNSHLSVKTPHNGGGFVVIPRDYQHDKIDVPTLGIPKSRVWARMPLTPPDVPNVEMPSDD